MNEITNYGRLSFAEFMEHQKKPAAAGYKHKEFGITTELSEEI